VEKLNLALADFSSKEVMELSRLLVKLNAIAVDDGLERGVR